MINGSSTLPVMMAGVLFWAEPASTAFIVVSIAVVTWNHAASSHQSLRFVATETSPYSSEVIQTRLKVATD
jgi:hypothetical protein